MTVFFHSLKLITMLMRRHYHIQCVVIENKSCTGKKNTLTEIEVNLIANTIHTCFNIIKISIDKKPAVLSKCLN